MTLLEVEGLNSYYGESHILFDVALEVRSDEVVALLGRNGAGKTTTLKSLMGVVTPRSGRVMLAGEPIIGLSPDKIANLGMQLVPEERRIIGTLTVHENLKLALITAQNGRSFEEIYRLFPRLEERRKSRGKDLSGGEQQMLSIARALIRNASLILLDEPFEGLAPIIVQDLVKTCRRLAKENGQPSVIVEQNLAAALSLADRCYVISNGHIVYHGTQAELRASKEVIHRYLGV